MNFCHLNKFHTRSLTLNAHTCRSKKGFLWLIRSKSIFEVTMRFFSSRKQHRTWIFWMLNKHNLPYKNYMFVVSRFCSLFLFLSPFYSIHGLTWAAIAACRWKFQTKTDQQLIDFLLSGTFLGCVFRLLISILLLEFTRRCKTTCSTIKRRK